MNKILPIPEKWTRWFRPAPAERETPLLKELTDYFFGAATNDRARILRDDALRQGISDQYRDRLEQNIKLEIQSLLQKYSELDYIIDFEKKLSELMLPDKLTDEVFSNSDGLGALMRYRGWVIRRPLKAVEVRTISGVLLRAVQLTALDIVRTYPLTTDVPLIQKPTEDVIASVLSRVDSISRTEMPLPPVRGLLETLTELSVLVARSRSGAYLPLRSIPTAPLTDADLANHYKGRSDAEEQRLARQIRHADGTILVTGYRGSGKSSFVNRAIFHALKAQEKGPQDGWLIVPVTVNLAKVSGIQHILRLTLRAVREALLESETLEARSYPRPTTAESENGERLPLNYEAEIAPLHDAYVRATMKVTLTRSMDDESSREIGSSLSLDPGKLMALAGFGLGKLFSAAVSRKRVAKVNRSLSMLDYDENAAEDDIAKLIKNLAKERPMTNHTGTRVRIKLVFVFDELDKMDDKGLEKMIEGLKNLFLQQHSVFILVTSKSFYYKLIKERAIEDAMLGSYFSSVVHVPLMTFDQTLQIVSDWVDRSGTDLLVTLTPEENKLLEQLTRALVYRSFGNPREIIRHLRNMNEWGALDSRPYLSERAARGAPFQIYAAIQECIEKVAVPQSSTARTESDGTVVVLASERLVGDEARLEQIRRGLYILIEQLIDQQTLSLDPAVLVNLQKTNFSLITVGEVRDMARRLGFFLSKMHEALPDEVFSALGSGGKRQLFNDPQSSDELRVTPDFYRLTGRQVVAQASEKTEPAQPDKTDLDLIRDAENLAKQPGWVEQSSAIRNIKALRESSKITLPLKEFLLRIVQTDRDASHRLAAAEQLPNPVLFDQNLDLTKLISGEKDGRVLNAYLSRLGTATTQTQRKRATDTLIELWQQDKAAASRAARRLTGDRAVVVLDALKSVANRDVTSEVLDWICDVKETEFVVRNALTTLDSLSEKFKVDLATKIISNAKWLKEFSQPTPNVFTQFEPENIARLPENIARFHYLRDLLRSDPVGYAGKLLAADTSIDVTALLAHAYDLAFDARDERLPLEIFNGLVKDGKRLPTAKRIADALRQTNEFRSRLLPYLKTQIEVLAAKGQLTEADAKPLRKNIIEASAAVEPTPPPRSVLKNFESLRTKIENATKEDNGRRDLNLSKITLAVLGGLIAFILGAFFYRRDLPDPVSWFKVAASRVLLLLGDVTVFFTIVEPFTKPPAKATAGTTSSTDRFKPQMLLVAGGLFYVHGKYIAPLVFRNQLWQFLINLPAIVLFFYAWRQVVSQNSDSGFRNKE